MKIRKNNCIYALAACITTLSVLCKYTLEYSALQNKLLNLLNKAVLSFDIPGLTDIFVAVATFMLIKYVADREDKIDIPTVVFSAILSVLLVMGYSFKKNQSLVFLTGSLSQAVISLICIVGFMIPIYCVMRIIGSYLVKDDKKDWNLSFCDRHIWLLSAAVIGCSWLLWLLINYPGTYCPDSVRQLSEFLGYNPMTSWQPPFSSMLMGVCFVLGQKTLGASFGFFLYCFLQIAVGTIILSYGIKVIRKIGASMKCCVGITAFFSLVPLWGVHAQWHDKDLLYSLMCLLPVIVLFEVLQKKECTIKQCIILLIGSVLMCLLRNNGIYTILPALIVFCMILKKSNRVKMIVTTLLVLVLYLGVTQMLYPALNIGKGSIGEALSVPIQQTARYVCNYDSEVTNEEREILSQNFHYEELFNYNPEISDPVKNHFIAGNLSGYIKVWAKMFFKHPMCYVEAFLAKGYGYLGPVEVKIEGWVGETYDGMLSELGVAHQGSATLRELLRQIMFIGESFPVIRLFFSSGTYSWILFTVTFLLIRYKKFNRLPILILAYMNLLICLASPLNNAMRYALPTVIMIPYLMAFLESSFKKEKNIAEPTRYEDGK